MEFLKAVLGEEFYNQFAEKINAYNGDEANKDKQVKLGNLASGEYVGKGKFDALQETLNGKDMELTSANDLIAQLKKSSKGNEEMQGKITDYETEVAKLKQQLQETEIRSAVKVALMSEKAVDVDYLTYKLNEKLKEKGESLELDENGKIKGWDDLSSSLKTQFPKMFDTASDDGGYKPLDDGKLPDTDKREEEPKTLAEALRQNYENK